MVTRLEGFPGGTSGEPSCQFKRCKRLRFSPWVGNLRRAWQPTPAFLPGGPHGQRSLAGCRPCSGKGPDTAEHISTDQAGRAGGEGEGIHCEFGTDMHTLLSLKWITNKELLYSTDCFILANVESKTVSTGNYNKAPGTEVPLWYLSLPHSTKLLFPSMKKSKLCDLKGTSAISPNEEGTQEIGPMTRINLYQAPEDPM